MLHNNLTRLALLVAPLLTGAAVASCQTDQSRPAASAQETDSAQPPAMPAPNGDATMTQGFRNTCPMAVQGADVSVSDTDGGVAMTFTTESGDVADLRARTQHMAQMYEMHRGQRNFMWRHMGGGQGYGHMGGGHMGGGQGYGHMGQGLGPMPAASATVKNVEKGARIELRPRDPSQLDALRQRMQWHAQRMQSGYCWGPRQGSSS